MPPSPFPLFPALALALWLGALVPAASAAPDTSSAAEALLAAAPAEANASPEGGLDLPPEGVAPLAGLTAAQAQRLRPLAAPGESGLRMPHRYAGPLGLSGLSVVASALMLRVTVVAPESPAALADVPAPTRGRVRLVAIDGLPVESYAKDALLARFAAGEPEVRLTFGWRENEREPERFVGPYLVPLEAADIAAQRGRYLAAARRAEGAVGDTWLAAHEAASAGDYTQALTWLAGLPASEAHRHWRERWQDAQVDQALEQAARLADAGEWSAVATALTRVAPQNAWQKLRLDEQRARLSAALAQRGTHRRGR